MYNVRVKIIAKEGNCVFNHELGDEWIIGPNTPTSGVNTPLGICNGAYNSIYPFIRVLQFGGQYEWPAGSGTCQHCCPDPYNQIIFELTRIEESQREVWKNT